MFGIFFIFLDNVIEFREEQLENADSPNVSMLSGRITLLSDEQLEKQFPGIDAIPSPIETLANFVHL